MIASLTGSIQSKTATSIVINCNGVGYEVLVPTQTRFDLDHAKHEVVTLATHLVIKEDSHSLFGFSTHRDRDLFRVLITVSGIGAKTALGILSCYSSGEVAEIITEKNVAALTKVPGIGKKGAEKMIVELDKKVQPFVYVDPAEKERMSQAESSQKDALEAMMSLGFREKDAQKAIEAVFMDGMSVSEVTRAALKHV